MGILILVRAILAVVRPLPKILALVLAVAGLSGCGSEPPSAVSLLDRLAPLTPPAAAVIDVSRARDDLGVGDIGFIDALSSDDPAKARFGYLVSVGFPLLRSPVKVALLDALDSAKVTAVAANAVAYTRTAVTLIATDQPFDEIAEALVKAGYVRSGNLLRGPATLKPVEAQAVAGGEGVIAVGADIESVQAAAEGKGGGIKGPVRDLVTARDVPAAAAVETGTACPKALAVTDDVKNRRAQLVILDSAPKASRFTAGRGSFIFRTFTFSEPKVDPDRITVDLTYPAGTTSPQPMESLYGETPIEGIYNCEK
jgi:hypothetical protein